MSHRLFYTDRDVSEADYRASKPRLMHFVYDDRDDALGMAREVEARGGIAWEIESDDGAAIGRAEIARLLRDRAAELADRPKVR